jgi:hypothetical protein
MSVSWKVQINPGKLWFEVRGALTKLLLVGLPALFVPSLHATLEEFVVGGVVCIFASVVLHPPLYAAIHMAVICLTAPRPTKAERSRDPALGAARECATASRPSAAAVRFPAHEMTRTVGGSTTQLRPVIPLRSTSSRNTTASMTNIELLAAADRMGLEVLSRRRRAYRTDPECSAAGSR